MHYGLVNAKSKFRDFLPGVFNRIFIGTKQEPHQSPPELTHLLNQFILSVVSPVELERKPAATAYFEDKSEDPCFVRMM